MKIVHTCLCGVYTDGWTYQDNCLTKYHKKLGNEVSVITGQWNYDSNGKYVLNNKEEYFDENGVKIIRLRIKGNHDTVYRFKRYEGLYKALEKEKPETLFIHGCQCIDMKVIKEYIKKSRIKKVYVDNHADFSNSATNWLSKNVLHKMIWRHYAKLIEPYVRCFYGVMPARVDFLKEIYHIPEDKIKLLVMGADDDEVVEARRPEVRERLREGYGVKKDEFLIVTGGKIDMAKTQVLKLMEACGQIDGVRLIVFGSVEEVLKERLESLELPSKIQYIGWVQGTESYKYFAMADLVAFPGRHSVFWEQTVGLGIPGIFKYWKGTTHIDLGGNCRFLYKDSVEEMKNVIEEIYSDKKLYKEMKDVAEKLGMKKFSYKQIAANSIEAEG